MNDSERLAILAGAIHLLHFPAYRTWPPDPVCEECRGAAGVHPCGCWAEEDREVVCGECSKRTHGGQLAWVSWPRPTVERVIALDATCREEAKA